MCVCVCLLIPSPQGQAYVVCGDDKGRLWTYNISKLQKNSLQTGKPILPTEVLISSQCLVYYKLCFHTVLQENLLNML